MDGIVAIDRCMRFSMLVVVLVVSTQAHGAWLPVEREAAARTPAVEQLQTLLVLPHLSLSTTGCIHL
jgi:hypothetical protein